VILPATRIDERLAEVLAKGERALTLFLTAGFPELTSTPDLVLELEDAGADIIELGMPFSDPLADGPVIQESSAIALRNGASLNTILGDVREIRKRSQIPIVLMGYLNPIMRYGTERFFQDAHAAGVDGIILPEVPKEELDQFGGIIRGNNLSNILLVAPTSSNERIEEIDKLSSGFLYCVSTTGVTGRGSQVPASGYIKRVKAHAKRNPVLVGFGISTSKEARQFARECDGVIVGSALIKRIMRGRDKRFRDWVAEFKNVLR
jgi:tryptophan synthase alpha chain